MPNHRTLCRHAVIAIVASLLAGPVLAQDGTAPKPATEATKAANAALKAYLNFDDKQDFEDAQRGLIEAPATLTIKNA